MQPNLKNCLKEGILSLSTIALVIMRFIFKSLNDFLIEDITSTELPC